MTIPIERQRRLCAKAMGLVKYWEHELESKGNCYSLGGVFYCNVADYCPDEDIAHAARLKDRLRELEDVSYDILYDEKSKVHQVTIWPKDDTFAAESLVSEEAALTAAVAEMQASKEKE